MPKAPLPPRPCRVRAPPAGRPCYVNVSQCNTVGGRSGTARQINQRRRPLRRPRTGPRRHVCISCGVTANKAPALSVGSCIRTCTAGLGLAGGAARLRPYLDMPELGGPRSSAAREGGRGSRVRAAAARLRWGQENQPPTRNRLDSDCLRQARREVTARRTRS